MEEKLQEILNEYSEDIERYKSIRDKLMSRMEFCDIHKFTEESRITHVKFEAINMLIYRWENMYKEIQELLNKWNS
jgi:hypothetical protein